jgi:trigger factor
MTLDASALQVSVQEQERWRRRMSVTVPASVVRQEEQRAAKKLASKARMKGFRKGRVPARVIESRFGGALRREALDRLIGEAYRHALAVERLRPISEGEVEDLRYEPDEDLSFSITFDVQPVIDLQRLGGFAVERSIPAVTAEHVEGVLARIQEQNGVWRPVEEGAPEDGDLVSVKLIKLEGDEEADAREYDIVIGQGDAIPDIEAAIKTLDPGRTGDFDISFPEDFPDESRRGEAGRVRVTLQGRRKLEVPELNDDFARQVGPFESLDQLRSKVREDVEREAAQRAEAVVRGRLLDFVIEANRFEVPVSMVDRYASGIIGDGKDIPEDRLREIREQLRPEAERAVKRILVVERIAETQNLAAGEDEIDARVEEIAAANDSTAAQVYASLQKAGRLESLERELTERKVFDFLKEQSQITDAPAA